MPQKPIAGNGRVYPAGRLWCYSRWRNDADDRSCNWVGELHCFWLFRDPLIGHSSE